MKKLIAFILLCGSAFATTTVTGKIQTLGTTNVANGAFVRFWLRGCRGNQPRINGTSVIAPSQGGVFYFDMPAGASGVVSGTLYSTRDSTGLLGGDIECGGSTTAVWYGMQIFQAGKGGPEVAIHAKNTATLDISNITPITTNPVIAAPTGDSTYARLDGGNQPFTGGVKTPSAQVTAVAFSSLPTCNAGAEGSLRPVTDSTTVTWGATIAGSSTNHVLAYCDGTNWTVAAK